MRLSVVFVFFFFKLMTAYEMRISDWSSDVCSSDLEKFSPWVGRLWEERPQRYSRAMLETMALIAYRQPITRGEIEDVRGVAVNSHIVKTLLEREWVRVVGYRDVPGKPAMFATTKAFLDHFNLKNQIGRAHV